MKKLVSLLLVFVLIIGITPINAYADNPDCTSKDGEYGSFIDGSHVIDDLVAKYGANTHPRIIMTEEKFAELRTHIGKDTVTGKLLEELRGEADRHVREDSVCTYKQDEEGYLLETSKKIQYRVAALALAYNIFGDEKYAKRAYQELEAACNFSDWGPNHFLDTAEMCTAFAYGYDWLYNWMSEDQRNLLRKNMIEKGLKQVMEDYTGVYTNVQYSNPRTYKWYNSQMGDNWVFVCTGGTNLAALAIGDESDAKDISADVITYGYKKAYTAVRQGYSATDGTYIEGLGYWDYATYYLGLQSSALKSVTGTDYGLTNYEGIRKSVDFVRYMSSNYPYSFSFGDDGDSRDTSWSVFLWLGEHFNSAELSKIRLDKIDDDREFRYLDVLWIDESKQSELGNDNATDWGSVGASNASFRNTWDISGTVAALHVGKNNYLYHGHYDLGSFYIESNGARFFTDLGNENYNLTNREYSYRVKPEGHNTLVINPSKGTDQCNNVECLITEYTAGNEAYAVTDLTKAYGDNDAQSVIRGLKMIKDKECVVIQDEISLKSSGEIYWFAHTKGQIEVASDGRSAIVTVINNGITNKMWVGLLSEGGKLYEMKAEPLSTSLNVSGAANNSAYRKLAIHLTDTKEATITVACIPLKNGESSPSWIPSVKAISDWANGDEPQHIHTGTKVDRIEATCTSCAIKEYYVCSCGCYFEDAKCTKPIDDIESWTEGNPLGHDFTGDFDGYDENDHWYICNREGCNETDMPIAHYGGTASIAGQAICEGCGKHYGETLILPEVTAPTCKSMVTYDPNKTLKDYELIGGSASNDDTEVAGKWSWKNEDAIPKVSVSEYTAVFMPDYTSKYAPVEVVVLIDVKKAESEFTTKPTAGSITYGQKILDATLTGGTTSVPGTIAWETGDAELRPTVDESKNNTYTVIFKPNDAVNYEETSVEVSVVVTKAIEAPYKPVTTMNPSYKVTKVSDIELTNNWTWSKDSNNTTLTPGETYVALAVYAGEDAGNYEIESVDISITRSTCDHIEEIRDAREASCSEEGYTGDKYCSICGDLITKGSSIEKLSHSGGIASCIAPKKCTVCGESYGDVNPDKHGETEERGKVVATCILDGYSGDVYCKACNELIEEGSVDKKAMGHSYEKTVTKEPTYDEEGQLTYTCSLCDDSFTETVGIRPIDIPVLKDDNSIRGWETITGYLATDASEKSVTITMIGTYIIPASVLEAIVGKDIEVTFEVASEDISWTIDGMDLYVDNIVDVDIRDIPENIVIKEKDIEVKETEIKKDEIIKNNNIGSGKVEDNVKDTVVAETSQSETSQPNTLAEVAQATTTDVASKQVYTDVPKKPAAQSETNTNTQPQKKNAKTTSNEQSKEARSITKSNKTPGNADNEVKVASDEPVIIEDSAVPTANTSAEITDIDNSNNNNSMVLPVAGVSALVVIIAIAVYVIKRRKTY